MPKPRLVTIGASHYCEKSRWALERAGIEYIEEPHAPILHYAATLPRHRQRSTPLLVTPHGTIRDSTDILRHADKFVGAADRLFPSEEPAASEVEKLEESFDRRLGPASRRLAYFHLLDDRESMKLLVADGVPRAERVAFRFGLPAIVAMLRRGLRIDAEGARKSEQRIEAVFGEVDERLAHGERYLVGDRFSAADLTFAALAAPVLLPPEYGWPLPPPEAGSPELRRLIERFRSRPAGAFALRLYRDHRRQSGIPTGAGA